MYRTLSDLRFQAREEADDTLKVLCAIPDTAATQAVDAAHRDLRRLAWHLVESLVGLPAQIGLTVDGPALDAQGCSVDAIPAAFAEIAEQYERSFESLLAALDGWDDADLQKEHTVYGHMTWTAGYAFKALEMHQAHHRGQMTVLMRQAGLKVPAFYGPAQEDWVAMGMPEPRV